LGRPLIFFAGASGVGKSALAQAVRDEMGLPYMPSVNNQVYQDLKTTFEDAVIRPQLIYQAQKEIYTRVLANLNAAVASGSGLVADRSVDLVVYTVEMLGGWDFYKDWGLDKLEAVVRRPEALLFFVRPHPDVLAVARARDNGRRAMFLTEDCVRRMDGAMEMYFEDRGFKYVTLDSPRMKDRCRTVRRVVELWQGGRGD
jgi:hypothetical protein